MSLGRFRFVTTDGRVIDPPLYAHLETVTIAGATYYTLKTVPADTTGASFTASTGSTGKILFSYGGVGACFVFPLQGIARIEASTVYAVYRAYMSGGTVNGVIDILIRKSDGTVRTTIATSVSASANFGTSWSTLTGANYSFPGYDVVDQTDYLEIDFYANVTVKKAGQYAYLRVDDNTLAATDQTRTEGWTFTSAPREIIVQSPAALSDEFSYLLVASRTVLSAAQLTDYVTYARGVLSRIVESLSAVGDSAFRMSVRAALSAQQIADYSGRVINAVRLIASAAAIADALKRMLARSALSALAAQDVLFRVPVRSVTDWQAASDASYRTVARAAASAPSFNDVAFRALVRPSLDAQAVSDAVAVAKMKALTVTSVLQLLDALAVSNRLHRTVQSATLVAESAVRSVGAFRLVQSPFSALDSLFIGQVRSAVVSSAQVLADSLMRSCVRLSQSAAAPSDVVFRTARSLKFIQSWAAVSDAFMRACSASALDSAVLADRTARTISKTYLMDALSVFDASVKILPRTTASSSLIADFTAKAVGRTLLVVASASDMILRALVLAIIEQLIAVSAVARALLTQKLSPQSVIDTPFRIVRASRRIESWATVLDALMKTCLKFLADMSSAFDAAVKMLFRTNVSSAQVDDLPFKTVRRVALSAQSLIDAVFVFRSARRVLLDAVPPSDSIVRALRTAVFEQSVVSSVVARALLARLASVQSVQDLILYERAVGNIRVVESALTLSDAVRRSAVKTLLDFTYVALFTYRAFMRVAASHQVLTDSAIRTVRRCPAAEQQSVQSVAVRRLVRSTVIAVQLALLDARVRQIARSLQDAAVAQSAAVRSVLVSARRSVLAVEDAVVRSAAVSRAVPDAAAVLDRAYYIIARFKEVRQMLKSIAYVLDSFVFIEQVGRHRSVAFVSDEVSFRVIRRRD